MKKGYLIALFNIIAISVFAQDNIQPRQFVSVGIAGGYSEKLTLLSTPVVYHHQIAGIQGLYYTVGLRQNMAYGRREFTINGTKTLIDDISNYGLNILAGIEYRYKDILIGGNIDLAGLNIGTRSYKTVGKDPVYEINPEPYNLIGIRGCLNNELYLGYRFTPSLALKVGLSVYNMSLVYSNSKTNETSAFTGSVLPLLKIDYTLWQKD
jgi:hypothetical protein